MARDGILSGPIDLDGSRRGYVKPPDVEATPGLALTERGTGARFTLVSFADPQVVVTDGLGAKRRFRHHPGLFAVDGRPVTLVAPRRPESATTASARTASGSIAGPRRPARVARASRLLVEGVHDAELVERVWGDDLRHEGVVVERLDGADHLEAVAAELRPGPGRRLGVLLDHLVEGSKEARIAAGWRRHDHVLVLGHPYVDIWQAVKPSALGIPAWPEVPRGRPWKEGVCAALGRDDPRAFWREILAAVDDWTALETPLVHAVESLVDFVTEP